MIVIFLHSLSFATTPLLAFGPFKIFVLSHALQGGWRRALPLALTPLVADIPVILLVWLVLRQLPGQAIDILLVTGGVFFFYLAYVLYRNTRRMGAVDERIANAPKRSFWQAVFSIWVSPQVYINWTAIGIPALLGYTDQALWRGIAFLVSFYILWIGGLAAQIILFGQASRINVQANNIVIMAASLLLTGFGIYQIWLGATRLLNH
ncbi:MAG: LysE family transporter [Anaerolineales bacterium]|jgi:threonine/homoserine/homoserine lactone efflux protein